MTSEHIERWAEFSGDGVYRYVLGRRWDADLPTCVVIMLNPSTADADRDDPTIRRCLGYARSLGCGTLLVGNLYAYRATDPRALRAAGYPTGGEQNDRVLAELMQEGEFVVAAWGSHATAGRVAEVLNLPGAERLEALGTTKAGAPRHPLYVAGSEAPQRWGLTA